MTRVRQGRLIPKGSKPEAPRPPQEGGGHVNAKWETRRLLLGLRADAIKRGMLELAVIYGTSAIRLGREALDEAQK